MKTISAILLCLLGAALTAQVLPLSGAGPTALAAGGGGSVVFDAVGPSSAGAGLAAGSHTLGAVLTWSHTCTGSNRLLAVGIIYGNSPDSGMTFTVTYNGVSMTSQGIVHANAGTAGFAQLFTLVNPSSGANNVVVTSSATLSYTLTGGAVSFTGVNQSTPTQNFGTSSGTGTGPTKTTTSATGHMVVAVLANGNNVTSATSPNVSRWIKNQNTDTAAGNGAMGTAPGAGSVVTAWTVSADSYGIAAIDLIPA